MYVRFGRRIFDVLVAAAGLGVLLPFLIVIAILIFLRYGYRPLFVQWRTGLDEKPFEIYKFRTIHPARSSAGANVEEVAISGLGRLLRKSSIDELPQLWNVLKGEMSLIGPRPLLAEYLPCYENPDRIRHSVLPGMTGLAQVRGRNHLSWQEKFRYDRWYCKNQCLALDLYIFCQTLRAIFRKDGICATPLNTLKRESERRLATSGTC